MSDEDVEFCPVCRKWINIEGIMVKTLNGRECYVCCMCDLNGIDEEALKDEEALRYNGFII